MARRPPILLACLAFCLASTLTYQAFAADPDPELAAARQLFTDAMVAKRKGEFGVALKHLRRLLLAKESAGVYFHVAECEERLGHPYAARTSYLRAIELSNKMDAAAERKILKRSGAALARLKGDVPRLRLEFSTPPPKGLKVTVNNREIQGKGLKKPILVEVGAFSLHARAPGFKPLEKAGHLRKGEQKRLTLALQKHELPPKRARAKEPNVFVVPFVITGVSTVVAGVGAVVFNHLHTDLKNETDTQCNNPELICSELAQRRDRERQYLTAAVGLGITAGVGLIATSVLGLLALDHKSGGASPPSTAILVGPGNVAISGRFLARPAKTSETTSAGRRRGLILSSLGRACARASPGWGR